MNWANGVCVAVAGREICGGSTVRETTAANLGDFVFSPFELRFDPNPTVLKWMIENLHVPFVLAGVYAVIVPLAERAMRGRKPFRGPVEDLRFCWNCALSLFSFYGATRVVPAVLSGFQGGAHALACSAGRNSFGSGPSGVWVLVSSSET